MKRYLIFAALVAAFSAPAGNSYAKPWLDVPRAERMLKRAGLWDLWEIRWARQPGPHVVRFGVTQHVNVCGQASDLPYRVIVRASARGFRVYSSIHGPLGDPHHLSLPPLLCLEADSGAEERRPPMNFAKLTARKALR